MNEMKLALLAGEKGSKEKKEKIDNYAKYVREMYWPSVSLKKQLELEHVKSTLHTGNIRKSIDETTEAEANLPKSGPGIHYERPWRKAMAKAPRSLDPGTAEADRQRAGSEVPNSPKPYEDIKATSKRAGLTPMT